MGGVVHLGVLKLDVLVGLGVDGPITEGGGGLKVGAYKAVVLRYLKWRVSSCSICSNPISSFGGHFSANATGLIAKQDLLLPLTLGRTRKFIPALSYERCV